LSSSLSSSSSIVVTVVLEGTVLEGTVLEGTVSDGTVSDGTVLEGTVSDGTVSDGTVLEGTVLEGTVLDGSVFAIAVDDVTVSATTVGGTLVLATVAGTVDETVVACAVSVAGGWVGATFVAGEPLCCALTSAAAEPAPRTPARAMAMARCLFMQTTRRRAPSGWVCFQRALTADITLLQRSGSLA
jgi:hypothetical protein